MQLTKFLKFLYKFKCLQDKNNTPVKNVHVSTCKKWINAKNEYNIKHVIYKKCDIPVSWLGLELVNTQYNFDYCI